MATLNKRLTLILGTIAALLLIPLIGTMIPNGMNWAVSGMNWAVSDFLVAGFLLLTAGLSIEVVFRNVQKTEYRIALSFGNSGGVIPHCSRNSCRYFRLAYSWQLETLP